MTLPNLHDRDGIARTVQCIPPRVVKLARGLRAALDRTASTKS